ncbi:MAG: heme exporter protein A [Paracoccaceae bacterium]|jgi:heme exporter protein A
MNLLYAIVYQKSNLGGIRAGVRQILGHLPGSGRFPHRPVWATHIAMVLKVQDLACARGAMQILDGVGFSVAAGETLILRGPNGAGKTTLLRTLAGLTPPLAGIIEHAPDAIAYCAHADGLKTQLTVTENLLFWAQVFGQKNIDGAIEAFDLVPLRHRRAGSLSAGQKRRLSLARLLVTGRPIWCLDEPTVSLDTDSVARFAATIRTHLGDGGSAIIATHIDLGLPDARTLDIAPFIAKQGRADDPFTGEAFE